MTPELADIDQKASAQRLAAGLKRQRWAILATGLGGSVVLIVFLVGWIPGVANKSGIGGTIGVGFGAAFLASAGVVSWWLWTRIANLRAQSVSLTEQGILIEFVDGSVARINWMDPALHFSLKENSNPSVTSGCSLQWGSGGLGHYAHVSRLGVELLKTESQVRGLRQTVRSEGKQPNIWITTEFSRR